MKIATMCSIARSVSAFVLGLFATALTASAQLPGCTGTGGFIYMHDGSNIWNFDPTQPVSATNPTLNTISMPGGAGGLAVSTNLNSAGPSPTFYTVVSNNYWYYDGTTWVNTGHATGGTGAVNICGSGNFIYNLVGGTGQVYKYDGTGNGSLLVTVPGFNGGGPYDLQGDCNGNFYIINLTNPWMQMYNSAGALVTSYTVTGAPSASAGGGFGIIGNNVYVHNTNGFGIGTISGTTVTFTTNFSISPVSPGDFASCPLGGMPMSGVHDTFYNCQNGLPLQFTASGDTPFNWSVGSGTATISGNGKTVDVTASTTSVIYAVSSAENICSGSNTVTDTFVIIVPTATLDAGTSPDTVKGCGTFTKVLNAAVLNTTPGVTYEYAWAPAADIASGANTLQPIIIPQANTTYILTVSTPANHGGCSWTDTVEVITVDQSVTPEYDYVIKYGCDADTVEFTNLSIQSDFYRWDFADGTGDTATNPIHVYVTQNAFNVKLVASNDFCQDSVTHLIDTQHPLVAAFTVVRDSICQGDMVNFTNTSTFTTIGGPERFFWSFGDGGTDSVTNPAYTFQQAGVFNVMMTVTDFVPCSDTFYHTIVVDTMPSISFTTSDTTLCEGQAIEFIADYSRSGNLGIAWNFGDGNGLADQDQVSHGYDTSGVYTVLLLADYRVCPDQMFSQNITIQPFPTLNLGADTSICPNGEALVIGDLKNQFSDATWVWNTGDTTPFISVRHPGVYAAQVQLNGCVTDDSVYVSKDCYLDIPNSFTPNNDGVNDYFLPRQLLSKGLSGFRMSIYNRWGQLVFETDRVDGRGWDGRFNDKEQPMGVYIYMIEAVLKNGIRETYQGNVTLIR